MGVATDPNRPLVGPTPSYDTPLIIKSGDELPTMGGKLAVGKGPTSGGEWRLAHINKPARACQKFWTATVKKGIPRPWYHIMVLKSIRTFLACDHVRIEKVDHRGLERMSGSTEWV